MTDLIKEQFFEMAVMFYAGGVSAFLYKVFLKFKEKYPVGRTSGTAQNILFWVFLALIVSTFLDFACDGNLALYIILIYIFGWILAIAFDRFANS